MTLISGFSNQTITLKRWQGNNAYSEASYADPVQIRGRFEPGIGVKRTATGEEVDVESYLLTEAEINLRDLVDVPELGVEDEEIRRVDHVIAKSGKILGYEGYL